MPPELVDDFNKALKIDKMITDADFYELDPTILISTVCTILDKVAVKTNYRS